MSSIADECDNCPVVVTRRVNRTVLLWNDLVRKCLLTTGDRYCFDLLSGGRNSQVFAGFPAQQGELNNMSSKSPLPAALKNSIIGVLLFLQPEMLNFDLSGHITQSEVNLQISLSFATAIKKPPYNSVD